jgi:hypothetical protein
METPIRMKMEHAQNWLVFYPVAADDGEHEDGNRTAAGRSVAD